MQKMYLLLRNNKQSGPYSLQELVRLPLKSLDLIWEEGKSKSWAYPSEIDELKTHVKDEKKADDALTVYPDAHKELVLPRIKERSEGARLQGRIHVEVYVKLPDQKNQDGIPGEAKGEDEGPFIKESFAEGVSLREPGVVLNKKYVRDLNEIKEEYSKWISRQKTNPLQPVKRKFLVIWGVFIVLIAAAFITDRLNSVAAQPKKENQTIAAAGLQKSKPKNKKQQGIQNEKTGKTKNKKGTLPSSAAEDKKPVQKKSQAPAVSGINDKKEKKYLDADEVFRGLDIRVHYDTSKHEGLPGLRFSMHNRGELTINTAALNVIYKNEETLVLQKETLYFNNLLPGSTISVAASPPHQAKKVTYKPGLISIDGNIYYSKEE